MQVISFSRPIQFSIFLHTYSSPSFRSVTGEPTAFEDVYEMAVDVPLEPDVDMRRLVADHEEIIRRVEKVNEEVCRGSGCMCACQRCHFSLPCFCFGMRDTRALRRV